ncbi:MAG TPA: aldehyde dehydrogenase family protein [Candidatus Dormibacteraeota bacterium]|nr:aldehyde dehydrogenase family protein [Candidatus Dormibacteraeota bacterium]
MTVGATIPAARPDEAASNLVIPHFIDGERRAGTTQAMVSFATAKEADPAVAAAKKAQIGWSNHSLPRRTNVLFAFRELLHQHRSELAMAITHVPGKALADALGEVARGIENVEYACGLGGQGGH